METKNTLTTEEQKQQNQKLYNKILKSNHGVLAGSPQEIIWFIQAENWRKALNIKKLLERKLFIKYFPDWSVVFLGKCVAVDTRDFDFRLDNINSFSEYLSKIVTKHGSTYDHWEIEFDLSEANSEN